MSHPNGRQRALAVVYSRSDAGFFADHPDRHAYLRRAYDEECKGEFWALGEHDPKRRRIILWRVPEGNPHYEKLSKEQGGTPLLKIPFLAFADETIENDDKTLLPIVQNIMMEAAARMA